MSNQELADLVDEKIGNEDKDPDLKLWKKNPQLGEVSFCALRTSLSLIRQTALDSQADDPDRLEFCRMGCQSHRPVGWQVRCPPERNQLGQQRDRRRCDVYNGCAVQNVFGAHGPDLYG